MSEFDERTQHLLAQADQLLKRAQQKTMETTQDIPTLSDLVEPGTLVTTAGPATNWAEEPSGFSTANLAALKQTILAEVMFELERKLSRQLESRLEALLQPAVAAAITVSLSDMRQEINNAVGDAVKAAIERTLQANQR